MLATPATTLGRSSGSGATLGHRVPNPEHDIFSSDTSAVPGSGNRIADKAIQRWWMGIMMRAHIGPRSSRMLTKDAVQSLSLVTTGSHSSVFTRMPQAGSLELAAAGPGLSRPELGTGGATHGVQVQRAAAPVCTQVGRRRLGAGLYALKPWYTRLLTPIIKGAVAREISPDIFTAAGVLAAGAAGVAVALGCWPLVALFLALRLAGANLDGAVARARGVSRPWGFVLNEIGDRAADLLTFAGLAVWAAQQRGPGLHFLAWPVIMVLIAALAATLPTFAALAAAGAGAQRRNGGPLGKTERCLFVLVASAFPIVLPVVCTQLVNGSLITTVLRLRAARRELILQQQESTTVAAALPPLAPVLAS